MSSLLTMSLSFLQFWCCAAQKLKFEDGEEAETPAMNNDAVQKVMNDTDIVTGCILPFVGMGQFAFVASINRNFRESYTKYVSTVDNPPHVKISYTSSDTRPATDKDTFYEAAFITVSRAKLWFASTKRIQKQYGTSKFACEITAKIGNLPVLKWAHKNGCPWADTCYWAATNGHLDVLKYAHENGCPWHYWTSVCAAKNGHLDVLKWAHENGCPWNKWTLCRVAAKNGHLEILKYAHENGCPWDKYTCICAARNGHLDVLTYAHENGCPWDGLTCAAAASNGHLDVLKYAHANGCPWDSTTCSEAAQCGHLQVLKWACENGCPWDGQVRRTLYGHILEWAIHNGCPE